MKRKWGFDWGFDADGRFITEHKPMKTDHTEDMLDETYNSMPTTDRLLSNCCSAPLTVISGDEGTSFYLCTQCSNSADPVTKPEPKTYYRLPFNHAELFEMLEEARVEERKAVIQEMVTLSDEIESGNTTFEEWKAFKRFRNTMRDKLAQLEKAV